MTMTDRRWEGAYLLRLLFVPQIPPNRKAMPRALDNYNLPFPLDLLSHLLLSF